MLSFLQLLVYVHIHHIDICVYREEKYVTFIFLYLTDIHWCLHLKVYVLNFYDKDQQLYSVHCIDYFISNMMGQSLFSTPNILQITPSAMRTLRVLLQMADLVQITNMFHTSE